MQKSSKRGQLTGPLPNLHNDGRQRARPLRLDMQPAKTILKAFVQYRSLYRWEQVRQIADCRVVACRLGVVQNDVLRHVFLESADDVLLDVEYLDEILPGGPALLVTRSAAALIVSG